ncbi:MAG: hypothetical protein O3C63_03795 [Cyanobacteria bacterium]|nr:hypothetical protein [Cyanobacteriota bacterium]
MNLVNPSSSALPAAAPFAAPAPSILDLANVNLTLSTVRDYAGQLLRPDNSKLNALGLSPKDLAAITQLASDHVPKYMAALQTQDLNQIAQEDMRLLKQFWSHSFESPNETILTKALMLSVMNKLLEGKDTTANIQSGISRTGNLFIAFAKNLVGNILGAGQESEFSKDLAALASESIDGMVKSVMVPKFDAKADQTAMVSGSSRAWVALHQFLKSKNLSPDQELAAFKSYAQELNLFAPLRAVTSQFFGSLGGLKQVLSLNHNPAIQARVVGSTNT